jgi:hypothetical protein
VLIAVGDRRPLTKVLIAVAALASVSLLSSIIAEHPYYYIGENHTATQWQLRLGGSLKQ